MHIKCSQNNSQTNELNSSSEVKTGDNISPSNEKTMQTSLNEDDAGGGIMNS